MSEATAASTAAGPLYPKSFQVSVTSEMGELIESDARRFATERGLPKPSVSLVIREALDRHYAARLTQEGTQA